MLLAGEDSTPPKKRSVGEASEGEVHVVDKPANTRKTKWPPKSTKSWSAAIVVRCFGAMRHTNLTAVLKCKHAVVFTCFFKWTLSCTEN